MRSKKTKISKITEAAAVIAPTVSATVPEVSPAVGSYLARARLSGNPLLKANSATRIYTNERENGTTAILLAILGTIKGVLEKSRIVSVSEFAEAFATLRAGNFAADSWKRAEKNYSRIGGNSGSIAKKIGPVVTGLIREGKSGLLAGFDPAKIATAEVRGIVGYKY